MRDILRWVIHWLSAPVDRTPKPGRVALTVSAYGAAALTAAAYGGVTLTDTAYGGVALTVTPGG